MDLGYSRNYGMDHFVFVFFLGGGGGDKGGGRGKQNCCVIICLILPLFVFHIINIINTSSTIFCTKT